MKSLHLGMMVVALAPLAACGTSGLGAGSKTVDRKYSRSAPEAWKASVKSVEAENLTVTSETHDDRGGELLAARTDGNVVRIRVKSLDKWNTRVQSLDERKSRVTVQAGRGDRDQAERLQECIAESMGVPAAKPGWTGGSSLEATYRADLGSSAASAHRTFTALQLIQTDMEHRTTSGRIAGHRQDLTPVQIQLKRIDDLNTRVTFTAGHVQNDDNRAFARKMKDEYETTTGLEVSRQ